MSFPAPTARLLRAAVGRMLRLRKDESGQAVVESAIVMPLMTFLILGIIQLVMIQHAKIMTEYAAFNAARAGIVWNADDQVMENAALISLLPTYEGLFDEADVGSPQKMLRGILQRALLYQVNRRLPQAIGLLRQGSGRLIEQIPVQGIVGKSVKGVLGVGKDALLSIAENAADLALQQALSRALGSSDDRLVTVEIVNRLNSGLQQIAGGPAGTAGSLLTRRSGRVDFDDFKMRHRTRLTIKVRYLYMMRVPFANWIIHQAWLAGRAGKQLYGAIWNPQQGAAGETGFRNASGVSGPVGDPLLKKLGALGEQGVYMVPLTATYTMRMQSNPYHRQITL